MPADAQIKQLVYQTLAADTGIQEAGLASDPRPGVTGPAILPFALSTLSTPVYPCVTQHISLTTPDSRFEDASPGLPTAPIDNARLDIEIWVGPQKNDALIYTVAGRIEALFRNQSFSLAAGSAIDGTSSATAFRLKQLPMQLDLGPDSKLLWYWGVMSYLVRVQR